MKKLILVILIIICFEKCFSQADPNNFFRYSYFLLASDVHLDISDFNTPQHNAGWETCFFVRIKKRLFLISSSHAFNGVDVFWVRYSPKKFQHFEFRYFDDSTKSYKLHDINVGFQLMHDRVFSFQDQPDLAIIEIKDLPKHAVVNSIEQIIYHHKKHKNIQSAFFWGFQIPETPIPTLDQLLTTPQYRPFYQNDQFNILTPPQQQQFRLLIDQSESSLYSGTIADSSHYSPLYTNVDSLNYILYPKTKEGASGSPVFFINSNGKKDDVEFAGVEFGINKDYNVTYVVKYEEVLKMLKVKLKE